LNGNTSLHFACSQGAEYATFWLIGFGSDVNAKNNDGDTPLHLLMKNSDKLGGTRCFKELIFRGADKDLLNK
jgi:ankyrin repeat protein